MALWYDSKKREYASDGKNGWFKKYCDTLVADLNELFEAHFKGLSNRHNARDVDYDENMTVRDKLDDIDSDISEAVEDLQNKITAEASERKIEDAKLGVRIDAEAVARQKGDKDMMDALRSESEDLNNRIDEEALDRRNADTALGQRIDAEVEELKEKLRGTMPDPIYVNETELDDTFEPGFYRSLINKLKPDFGDVDTNWTVAVSNSSYTNDIGDTYYTITQAAIGDDGTIKAYRNACAQCENASQVLNFQDFGKWTLITLDIADIEGLHEKLTEIGNKANRKGSWTNPFVVSDPKTDLSTLTTPGIYYFDFDDVVFAITEPHDFGCYTKGYMQVAGLWNDQNSENVVGQILYVSDEGQFFSCTREVGSNGIAQNWRISAWVTDINNPDLERRVKALENAEGTWAKPYVVSHSETRLSTLKSPGVYHFEFSGSAELKGRGFYQGGYMEVAPVWGDNVKHLIWFQKIYTGYEGAVYTYTRTIQGEGVEDNDFGWRLVETSSANAYAASKEDQYLPSLEKRVAALENTIKSLTGGSDTGITTATDTEADAVLDKYFS